jgi:RNA polymerase sigma factor (sigma-70 family)
MDDRELLRQYVENRSESAFSEIVRRHLNLVYATAFRLVGDSHTAQDIAQSVFIRLAIKATFIREGNALPGWLYRAACGIAKDTLRGERRRRDRESEAMTQAELDAPESTEAVWKSVAPLLEEAIQQQLNDGEQNAVVLRFFESKPLSEVGRVLEISEDAAQKRVSRALEKLRSHFVRRGITLSAAALASALAAAAAHAAPSTLATLIASAAFTAGSTATVSGSALLTPPKLKAAVTIVGLTLIGVFIALFVHRYASRQTGSALATFRGIGDLPGGEFISYASSVSGDGKVVAGVSRGANGDEAFRWTLKEGIVGLSDRPGGRLASSASGVSADGSVMTGSSSAASGAQAFRWTQRTGMSSLGDLSGGLTSSIAYGISASGQFIVGESSSARGEREAFRWHLTEMMGLGSFAPEQFNSQAMAVSADGTVVIGISARSRASFEAFRWTQAAGMIGLGDFPGGVTNSNAYGISPDGRFIVGYGCPGTFDPYTHEAFRWTEAGGLEHLGFAPGTRNSAAYGVSADGNVVVGDNKSERPPTALIWTPQAGMRRLAEVLTNNYQLNLEGWQLTSARGISHDGRTIVGSGVNPSGQTEGWIVTLRTLSGTQGKP